jgi:hypothetical protein
VDRIGDGLFELYFWIRLFRNDGRKAHIAAL